MTTVIAIVGCGGIGGYLALPLLRYIENLYYDEEDDDVVLRLIDGDSFETKNIDRQVVSSDAMGINKARWLAGYLSLFVSKQTTKIFPVEEYITPKNIENILLGVDTVFLCVDNDKTRIQIEDYWNSIQRNFVIINGGNETIDGNVQICYGSMIKSMSEVHKDMKTTEDRNPGESCTNIEDTTPQICIVNNFVASLMLVQYYRLTWYVLRQNLLDRNMVFKKEWEPVDGHHELYFDVRTGEVVSYDRTRKEN